MTHPLENESNESKVFKTPLSGELLDINRIALHNLNQKGAEFLEEESYLSDKSEYRSKKVLDTLNKKGLVNPIALANKIKQKIEDFGLNIIEFNLHTVFELRRSSKELDDDSLSYAQDSYEANSNCLNNNILVMNGFVNVCNIIIVQFLDKETTEVEVSFINKKNQITLEFPVNSISKVLKEITNISKGTFFINPVNSASIKQIEMIIKLQLSESTAINKFGYTGFLNNFKGFAFGDEIILASSIEKLSKISPHSSIAEFSLERDSNIAPYDAIKFVYENIGGLSKEKKFLGFEFLLVRILGLKMSKLRNLPETPSIIKIFLGTTQSFKTETAKNTIPICGSKKNKVEMNLISTVPAIEDYVKRHRDQAILIDDKAEVEDKELENHMNNVLNMFVRIYGDGTQRNKFRSEIKPIDNIAVMTAEKLPLKMSISTLCRCDITKLEKTDIQEDKVINIRSNPKVDSQFTYYYIKFLLDLPDDYMPKFYSRFVYFRSVLSERLPSAERRFLSNRAWFIAQFEEFLDFLEINNFHNRQKASKELTEFIDYCILQIEESMERLNKAQPLKLFFGALNSELDAGNAKIEKIEIGDKNSKLVKAKISRRTVGAKSVIDVPDDFIGFYEGGCYNLIPNQALKIVRKYFSKIKKNFDYEIDCIYDMMEKQNVLITENNRIGNSETDSKSNNSARTYRITVNGFQFRCMRLTSEDFRLLSRGKDYNEDPS